MYPVSQAFLNAVKVPFLVKVSISDLNIRKEGIPMNEVFDILEEYDFSQGIKNPYMKRR